MTTTDQKINRFAYVLTQANAHHGEHGKVFVQNDGTLRIVTRSVSAAKIMISRAEHYGNIKLCDIAEIYQVRFWGTDLVATYPTYPKSEGIDRNTGMIRDQSSPELVSPWRYICGHCGQQPLHHVRTCPNRKR